MRKALSSGHVQLELFSLVNEPISSTPESDKDYLLGWAKRHNYPDLAFPLPCPYYGFNQAIIPEGRIAWEHCCDNPYSPDWLRSAVKIAKKQEE